MPERRHCEIWSQYSILQHEASLRTKRDIDGFLPSSGLVQWLFSYHLYLLKNVWFFISQTHLIHTRVGLNFEAMDGTYLVASPCLVKNLQCKSFDRVCGRKSNQIQGYADMIEDSRIYALKDWKGFLKIKPKNFVEHLYVQFYVNDPLISFCKANNSWISMKHHPFKLHNSQTYIPLFISWCRPGITV